MRRLLSLFACLIAVGGSAVGGVSASADLTDSDAAYCPYGFITGVGTWTPPESIALAPHSFAWDTYATCDGGLDETGVYHIVFNGSAIDSCAAGNGNGSLAGSGPEGTVNGTFTFHRGGIHLYISGDFLSAGEWHTLQYWLDVLPLSDPCNYSSAPLIGHGAISDWPLPGPPPTA